MLSDENKLRIFSGNANPDLAREIAAYLGTTVGDAVINLSLIHISEPTRH